MGYRKNCNYKKLENRIAVLAEQVEDDNAIDNYIAKIACNNEQEIAWMKADIKYFRKSICDLFTEIRKIKEHEKLPERWFTVILTLEGVQFFVWLISRFI